MKKERAGETKFIRNKVIVVNAVIQLTLKIIRFGILLTAVIARGSCGLENIFLSFRE